MDIGCEHHYVIIGLSNGERLDESSLDHEANAIQDFFNKIEEYKKKYDLPVAMEAYNGYARPIDQYVLRNGYRLLNVNNNKLAQFKKIFPGSAKNESIDAQKFFELFTLSEHLSIAKSVLQEVYNVPKVNEKLKILTRRRRRLVNEQTRLSNRLQSDLHAISPELLNLTGSIYNTFFVIGK